LKAIEHVGRVPGRGDALAAELDLERRHAVAGARRRADLGREVRQGREIVAAERRGHGELQTLQLNAVAGVAGKAHYVADPPGRRVVQDICPLEGWYDGRALY
jgi:hypothetical protein